MSFTSYKISKRDREKRTDHVDFGFVFVHKANSDTVHVDQFQLQSIRFKQSFLFQAQVHPGGFSWLAGKHLFVLVGLRTWTGFKVLECFQVFFSATCGKMSMLIDR